MQRNEGGSIVIEEIHKKRLVSGATALYMPLPGARSAAVSLWVVAGSRHEQEDERGISHGIEHMVFKGTHNRTAREISEEMDRLGGNLNAYTTKEYTRYYVQTLTENAAPAMEILCDMLTDPRLEAADLELEKGVILNEMAMYEDNGEDVAHERLCAAVWPQSPLGRTILGTPESVSSWQPEQLRSYMRRTYTTDRLFAVVAGAFDEEEMTALLNDRLSALPAQGQALQWDTPAFTPAVTLCQKDFEQTSLEWAVPGLAVGDERRYALMLLNYIVGGGPSSRLFLRLREEQGLVYSVYSSAYSCRGTGLFTVAASFSPRQQAAVLDSMGTVLKSLAVDGVTDEEIVRARAQVKSSYILGLETVASQATYAGRNELYEGRALPPEEVLNALDRLTTDDINGLARELLGQPQRALSVVGAVEPEAFYKGWLTSG